MKMKPREVKDDITLQTRLAGEQTLDQRKPAAGVGRMPVTRCVRILHNTLQQLRNQSDQPYITKRKSEQRAI